MHSCDIVFVDPDNELMVPSADGTAKSNKFDLPYELAEYCHAGASIIYYQHKARRPDEFYTNQQLVASGAFPGAISLCLKIHQDFSTILLLYLPSGACERVHHLCTTDDTVSLALLL